jgi:peptidoglycan/LPS O-acetylase OafA/YrhL
MITCRSVKYRPDIDGLRALAVLAVVAFHAFPEYITGGFVGVDIFFVISGFLIAGITLDEASKETFSFRRFYERRVRRIFPALLIVLVVVLMAGWLILLPNDLLRLGKQSLASAAFVANFYFWFQSGYFSPDARTFPLLHLWSLGVEEQFYILWPAIIVGVGRRADRTIYAILLIGLSSFCINIALMPNHEADFYFPVTRAWELMFGAALAWRKRHNAGAFPSRATANSATIVGLIMLGGSVVTFDQQSAYPGWLALVPTIGASLIVWGGASGGVACLILSSRPLVFVGLISYPLYLWHWPLLVFSEALKFAPLTALERFLIVAASFVFAWLTFEFVEKQFRGDNSTSGNKVAALAAGMMVVAVAGIVLIDEQGFYFRFPEQTREFAKAIEYPASWRIHKCLIDPKNESVFAEGCLERGRPLLFVWGDSTATALMPGLRQLQAEKTFGLTQFTANSCGPWLDVDVPNYPNCRTINSEILGIVSRSRPDVVLLHERGYMLGESLEGLKKTVAALHALSIRTVVLGPDPVWKRGLPHEAVRYLIIHHRLIPTRTSERVYQVWNNAQMASEMNKLGAEYISAWDAMCDSDGCLTRVGDRPEDIVALDQSHLTETGSNFLIQAIKDKIFPER